jgi:hypothetical protein
MILIFLYYYVHYINNYIYILYVYYFYIQYMRKVVVIPWDVLYIRCPVTWCSLRQVSSLKGPIFDAFVMALLHYFQLSTEQVTLEEWFRKGKRLHMEIPTYPAW